MRCCDEGIVTIQRIIFLSRLLREFSILPDRALLNIKAILYNKPVIFRFALVQPNLSLDLWSLARARIRLY